MASKHDPVSGSEHSVPEDVTNWRQWPTASVVAKRLRIHPHDVVRMVETGELQRWRAKDGTWRYHPDDVASLAAQFASAALELDEAGDKPEDAATRPAGVPDLRVFSDFMKASTDSYKAQSAHLDKILDLIVEPSTKVLDVLRAANDRLIEENTRLLELLKAQQAATAEQEEAQFARAIIRQQHESQQKRIEQTFGMLTTKVGPILLQKFAKRLGVPEGTVPSAGAAATKPPAVNGFDHAKVEAAIELLQSLDPAILQGLQQVDIFDPHQLELVNIITAKPAPADSAEPPTAEQKESIHA